MVEHQIGIERQPQVIDGSSVVTMYCAFCSCGQLKGEPSRYETIAFFDGTEHLDAESSGER